MTNKKGIVFFNTLAIIILVFIVLFVFIKIFPCFNIPLTDSRFCLEENPIFLTLEFFVWATIFFGIQIFFLFFYVNLIKLAINFVPTAQKLVKDLKGRAFGLKKTQPPTNNNG